MMDYKELKTHAEAGDAKAQYELGIYHNTRYDHKQLDELLSSNSLPMTSVEHFKMAEKYYLQCIQREVPKWSGLAAEKLGQLYEEIGDKYADCDRDNLAKAVRKYKCAIKMYQYAATSDNPNKAECFHSLGHLYNNCGNTTEAIKCFQCAIDLNIPNIGATYIAIGAVYEDDEDYTNAIATYKKILEGGNEMSLYCKELAEERLKELLN